jgi:hypothetical protein
LTPVIWIVPLKRNTGIAMNFRQQLDDPALSRERRARFPLDPDLPAARRLQRLVRPHKWFTLAPDTNSR